MGSITEITINKKQGITQALLDHVHRNNYKLSDGIVTPEEWAKTINVLKEIQNERKHENKDSIFRNNNVNLVYTSDKLEFSQDEIRRIYEAMGVEIQSVIDENEEPKLDQNSNIGNINSENEENSTILKSDKNVDKSNNDNSSIKLGNKQENDLIDILPIIAGVSLGATLFHYIPKFVAILKDKENYSANSNSLKELKNINKQLKNTTKVTIKGLKDIPRHIKYSLNSKIYGAAKISAKKALKTKLLKNPGKNIKLLYQSLKTGNKVAKEVKIVRKFGKLGAVATLAMECYNLYNAYKENNIEKQSINSTKSICGGFLGSQAGQTLGAIIGTTIPGIGAIVGKIVGGLVGYIGVKIFASE